MCSGVLFTTQVHIAKVLDLHSFFARQRMRSKRAWRLGQANRIDKLYSRQRSGLDHWVEWSCFYDLCVSWVDSRRGKGSSLVRGGEGEEGDR